MKPDEEDKDTWYKEDYVKTDYRCKLFSENTFTINKDKTGWQYGFRQCLSNFNDGKD